MMSPFVQKQSINKNKSLDNNNYFFNIILKFIIIIGKQFFFFCCWLAFNVIEIPTEFRKEFDTPTRILL